MFFPALKTTPIIITFFNVSLLCALINGGFSNKLVFTHSTRFRRNQSFVQIIMEAVDNLPLVSVCITVGISVLAILVLGIIEILRLKSEKS
uniref:7TM_GPCR_Srx domain-containing protein n=1 Tax=Steinernema glaseri TaxID=37863 RepID=A0A1I8AIH2_9BILA